MLPIIGVIGAGYVGLTTACCYAKKGYLVFLLEKDTQKLETLKSGKIPFYEEGLQELYSEVFGKQLFLVKNSSCFFEVNPAEIIFSCVPTPTKPDGSSDTSFVFEVLESLTKAANQNFILINKSTITPGTSEKIIEKLQSSNNKINYVYNPEFLRQGQAVSDFFHPDRIVFGANPPKQKAIYSTLLSLANHFVLNEKIIFTDCVTAELIKQGANAMLASRISFINQVARFAQAFGADMKMVEKGIGMDHRIGNKYLQSGPGFGGGCLPKDLSSLIKSGEEKNIDTSFLQEIYNFNHKQLDWFYDQWKIAAGPVEGASVAVMGMGFKSTTGDLRNSKQVELVKKIVADKPATLRIFDKTLCPVQLGKVRTFLKIDAFEEKKTQANKTLLLLRGKH